MKNALWCVSICAALLAGTVASAQTTDPTVPPPATTGGNSIVDVVANNPKLQTLSKLLESSGLADELKEQGKNGIGFTLFAPSDDAFKKVSQDMMDKLGADKEMLRKVLSYHILSRPMMATALINGQKLRTKEKEDLVVKTEGQALMINLAQVTQKDIAATNGLIDIIDMVLMPPSMDKG